MKILLLLVSMAISSAAYSKCDSIEYKENDSLKVITDPHQIGITVSREVWIPNVIENSEVIVDKGPMIIFTKKNSYVSIRSIDKSEVEFIGSNKTPYDFFSSSFNNPANLVECAFIDGIRGAEVYELFKNNEMEFYLTKANERYTIYLMSRSLDYVVEISTKNISKLLIDKILSESFVK